jgi:hypothetical protein
MHGVAPQCAIKQTAHCWAEEPGVAPPVSFHFQAAATPPFAGAPGSKGGLSFLLGTRFVVSKEGDCLVDRCSEGAKVSINYLPNDCRSMTSY